MGKPRMIQHGKRKYKELLTECAEIYLMIRDCRNCGAPHPNQYVCWRCGVDDMSKLVERLARDYHEWVMDESIPDIKRTNSNVARLFVNAIADELEEEDKSRMYRRYTPAVGYLRTQAEEES